MAVFTAGIVWYITFKTELVIYVKMQGPVLHFRPGLLKVRQFSPTAMKAAEIQLKLAHVIK